MGEIWKDIPNYEGLYMVSNWGRIKSFRKSSKYGCQDEYILKNTVANNGYCQVTLYKNAERSKFLVHRLVAEAFVPNKFGYPHINHKDENPLNNKATNLEWCTASYNNKYGTARIRAIDTRSMPVLQMTLDGKQLAIYRSAKIAAQLLGRERSNIKKACSTGNIAYGYYWKYCDFPYK